LIVIYELRHLLGEVAALLFTELPRKDGFSDSVLKNGLVSRARNPHRR
jgi:hypothetical protein